MSASPSEVESLAALANAARTQPVISTYPDLAVRILNRRHGITTVDGYETFLKKLADPGHRFDQDVIVRTPPEPTGAPTDPDLELDHNLTTYQPPDLPVVSYSGSPYTPELNEWVTDPWLSWNDVAETTLNQSRVADTVVEESYDADVVAVVIVDGLSYADWRRAGYGATPVYVDCPTVTHCGYPNVVCGGESNDGLATRLHRKEGFRRRRAFSYWEKDQTDLTDRLHDAFSPSDVVGDVTSFKDVLASLQEAPVSSDWRTYLQITLTGPERVAHRHKEDPDVVNEVKLVKQKLDDLYDVLKSQVDSPRVIATADHGMIWRMYCNEFAPLEGPWDANRRRYLEDPPSEWSLPADKGDRQHWDGTEYFRLEYPYLFHKLRSNEPGTHGGLSFQECLVPLISYPQQRYT